MLEDKVSISKKISEVPIITNERTTLILIIYIPVEARDHYRVKK